MSRMRVMIDDNGDRRLVDWSKVVPAARELAADGIEIADMPADKAIRLAVDHLDEQRAQQAEDDKA